jgi:hypothetical protein
MKTERAIRIRSIVQYQFDVGARMGTRTLFGVVEKAGPKSFTVRWESGIRNRGHPGVTLTTDSELLQEAAKTFPEALWAPLEGLVESRVNRITKTRIALYDAKTAGIDSDPELPWVTVCEDHGDLVGHPSLTLARSHMACPEWCSKCSAVIHGESADKDDET